MTHLALLGLGEAGRTFAAALAGTGQVTGWDPAANPDLPGVRLAPNAAEAVRGADAVLCFATAAHSADALASVAAALPPGTVYADFATAGPALKRRLADDAAAAGHAFVDAAIMAPVRRGAAAVPLLLCGEGAARLRDLLAGSGLQVEVLDGPAGTAAARKLLRSMLVKGLTGVMIESLRAAEAEGLLEWFSAHLVETLTALDQPALGGFVDGTRAHSARRVDELAAAADMAEAAGGTAAVTRAVADLIASVAQRGIPAGRALDA